MCTGRDWVFEKPAAVGRRRKLTRRVAGSGKPKGGHEGIKGHLSLAFLSLLPALLCVGSSKLLQLFFHKLFTFEYAHLALCLTPNHARRNLSFILKKFLSSRPQHRPQTIFQTFLTEMYLPRHKR